MEKQIGFELLKTRHIKDNIVIEEIENQINHKLPPLFRLFVETFHFGKDMMGGNKGSNLLKNEWCLIENNYWVCASWALETEIAISFGGFHDIQCVIDLYNIVRIPNNKNYLPIGEVSFQGAIEIGLTGKTTDKLYLADYEFGTKQLLAENIFKFMRMLVLYPAEEGGYMSRKHGVNPSQLYKNWNEDFWRVKE